MKKISLLMCVLLLIASCAGAQGVPANPASGSMPANPMGGRGNTGMVVSPESQKTEYEWINEEIFLLEWENFEALINGTLPAMLTNQNYYGYSKLVAGTSQGDGLLRLAEQVLGCRGTVKTQDYIDVLAGIVTMYTLNTPISEAQTDSENWSAAYIEKAAEMVMKESIGALSSDYAKTKAACGVFRLMEKFGEVDMSALHNEILQYERADRLLEQIEAHSDGDLKLAARTLRAGGGYSLLAKMQAYSEAILESEIITTFTFSDISIEPILPLLTIPFDDTSFEMVRYAFGAMEAAHLLLQLGGTSGAATWQLMKEGASLLANGAFGLDAFTQRLCELNVLFDIDGAMCRILVEQFESIDQPDYKLMEQTVATMRVLLYCHMQGESTIYYLMTNEMGAMSNAFDGKELESWYLQQRQMLHKWEEQLNSLNDSYGVVGAVVPLDEPQMDFSTMEVAITSPDGDEIARTKLHEDGVYVFHEPGMEYVNIKLYIDGQWKKTLKNVRLDKDISDYTRCDIYLFDSPYPAFVEEQVERYGRSDLSRASVSLSWSGGTDRWPQRRGVAGADVVDLNSDGYEELLIYRFVNNGNDTSEPNALRIYLYRTNEQGEVEESGWINLLESRRHSYCCLYVGIIEREGEEPRIYAERVERMADGYSISYETYVCDGYTVQSETWVGGSTDYYGALSMRDSGGKRTWLWFGSGALYEDYFSLTDLGNMAWAGFDSGEALWAGLKQMGFAPLSRFQHNDEGRDVIFPSLMDEGEYRIAFTYFCRGSDDESKESWAYEYSMLDALLEQAEDERK